jgi:hypothetical protein
MSESPPVFLFGMERSGTTLLSMMVGAHPEIAVPLATTGMWYEFYARLEEFGGLATPQDMQRLVDEVAGHERIRLWRTPLDIGRILEAVRPGDFGSVVAAFHQEYARQHGKPRWGNIDIATLDNMHLANRWFPDARFVHIVRDGRDVALSNQTMPYGAGNIDECAEAWARRIGMNLRMGDILGPQRYLAFRYEALIAEPEATLGRICAFLGLPFSAEMLAYGDTVDGRVPKEKQWLWPELKLPPQTSKINRWEREMTLNQRIVFEWRTRELMRELGYPVFDTIPRRFGAHLLELGYFLGRGGRVDRLLRKFGYHRKTSLERKAGKGDNP